MNTMSEAIAAYDDMLDEIHGDFMGMSASWTLRNADPIRYRVEFADWADFEGIDTDDLEDDADLP